MNNTARNRRRASQILSYLTAHPERHEQKNWFTYEGDTVHSYDQIEDFAGDDSPEDGDLCNTTMCVAGTAVFLDKTLDEFKDFAGNASYHDWFEEGSNVLGLDKEEAEYLFMSDTELAPRLLAHIAAGDLVAFHELAKAEFVHI